MPLWLLAAGLEFAVSPHRLQVRVGTSASQPKSSPVWKAYDLKERLINGDLRPFIVGQPKAGSIWPDSSHTLCKSVHKDPCLPILTM